MWTPSLPLHGCPAALSPRRPAALRVRALRTNFGKHFVFVSSIPLHSGRPFRIPGLGEETPVGSAQVR